MTTSNGNGAGASHLDFLRARHAAIAADRHLDLDVPGYQGRLVVRYGRVPWVAIAHAQELIAKPGRDGEGSLLAQADFLIAACREILVRDDAGELAPIDPSGAPRRFDAELGVLFETDATTARAVIRYVFANDPALAVQAGEVMEWTIRNEDDVADEFLGESAPVVK